MMLCEMTGQASRFEMGTFQAAMKVEFEIIYCEDKFVRFVKDIQ